MRSSWRTLVAGLSLAVGAAIAAFAPPAHAAGITIAIDPGHGGSDPGAVANGLREKDLTLAVSLALKEELESYDGVRVVMTRTTDTRPSENISTDLSSRVDMAAAANADALVSIHFNSGSPIAKGAEVWYANSSSYNYGTHTQGRALSDAIQKQLTGLGLADRGIKTRDNPYYDYPDGSTGDYYAIIRQSREENMTGIIVEHAFLTSPSDAALLRDESFVRSLGVADATGIAQAYGLSKGTWRVAGDSWRFISNGVAKTGWFSTGGRWYWAGSDERTIRGWSTINGRRYFFDSSTAMVTGWKKEDGKWYYLRSGGDMATGWVKVGSNWYWLRSNGAAATGWTNVAGAWYLFEDDARMLTGWQLTEDDNRWYYMRPNGHMVTGWLLDGGKWYYLDDEGAMKTGWTKVGDTWYHLNSSGAMSTGWLLDGAWYWLDSNSGAMATGTVTVEGRASTFASSGAWLGYADGSEAPAASRSASSGASVTNASGQRLIMTAPTASRAELIDAMEEAWDEAGYSYPSALSAGGAQTIREFASIVYDEAVAEGVSPELVFVQAMKETGWLRFGGDVSVSQYNFSGIGAVGGGAKGASFPDVRTGIRAQVQHLRAYADSSVTTASLTNPVVDPRFAYVRKGAAPVVEYLGIQENPNHTGWAAAKNYGYDLVSMMKAYF